MSQQPLNSTPNIDNKAPTSAVQGVSAPTPQGQAPTTPSQPDPRLEQLARKERALSKQMRDFQAQRAQFEADKKGLLAKDAWKQQFLQDPTSLGLSYQEISERFLQQPSPEQQRESELMRKIEALEQRIEATSTKIDDGTKGAYDQALKQISREASSLVEASKDYELVKAYDATQDAVSLIEEVYKSEGVLMTTEEALREVEGYLMEQAQKVLSIEKVRSGQKTPATEQATTPAQEASPQGPQGSQLDDATKQALVQARARNKQNISVTPRMPTHPTTLTNAMSQQSSTGAQGTMSARDRAVMAAMGKLTG